MSKAYSEKNIKVIVNDIDRLRAKPTMYIGLLESGVFSIWREVIDNCIDEFTAGRNKFIQLVVNVAERRVTVIDKGPGIPTGKTLVLGKPVSTLFSVFSYLHAGGKFDDQAYKTSRGTHGIGITATNALSSELTVWSNYKRGPGALQFKQGKTDKPLPRAIPVPKQLSKYAKDYGTMISFVPDPKIFGAKQFLELKQLEDFCEHTVYLNPGLTIKLDWHGTKGLTSKTWAERGGLGSWLKVQQEKLKSAVVVKPWTFTSPNLNLALMFTEHDDEHIKACTNSLHNVDGGTHYDLLLAQLHKKVLAQKSSRDGNFTPKDLSEGLVAVIDVRLSHPGFSSQSKEKLVDARVKTEIGPVLEQALTKWVLTNKVGIKALIKRALSLKALKDQHTLDKRALKALKTPRNGQLPTKLVTSTCKPEDREIYFVEGDSAGGPGKKARNPVTQEIYPMRGKLLNVYKAKEGQAFLQGKGKELSETVGIMQTLGYDPNNKDPLAKLRCRKIILLCDPDPDGYHINVLVLGLLVKYLRPLFALGYIYIALVHEFYAEYKDKRYYGDSPQAIRDQGVPAHVETKHIKGYGEISPLVMREMAFDLNTRKLLQLTAMNAKDIKNFLALMSEDSEYRKKLFNIITGI